MNGRATRADVARLAGVSKTTVTFVLSGRKDVSIPETTRERVRQAVRELNFRPSVVAQALARGKTNSISVAFPNLIVPHYARVLQVLERFTYARGYHMIAGTYGHIQAENTVSDLRWIFNSASDGVILIDVSEHHWPYIEGTLSGQKPLVSMGIFQVPGVDLVEVRMGEGAECAIRHLLSKNPRRLAYFNRTPAEALHAEVERALAGLGDPRTVAYYRGMAEAGASPETILAPLDGRAQNREVLREYARAHGAPDAIFCYDDELAISAHRAVRELNLRIPEDVRIVGCDGSEECEDLTPPLSTVAQPVEEMCSRAWEFLSERLADSELPTRHVRLQTELMIRQSSM